MWRTAFFLLMLLQVLQLISLPFTFQKSNPLWWLISLQLTKWCAVSVVTVRVFSSKPQQWILDWVNKKNNSLRRLYILTESVEELKDKQPCKNPSFRSLFVEKTASADWTQVIKGLVPKSNLNISCPDWYVLWLCSTSNRLGKAKLLHFQLLY